MCLLLLALVPVSLLPGQPGAAAAPARDLYGLPWEADWEFRRDFKADGKVDNGREAEKYRLRQYDFGQGAKGRTFLGMKGVFNVNIDLFPATTRNVVLLSQKDYSTCTLYAGTLVKAGLYRGTWHDHNGRSGDWEMSFLKEVAPVGVYGTTIDVAHPGINKKGPDGKRVVWKNAKGGFLVSALDERGKVVKQVTSGERGRYHLSLPPGKYRLAFKVPCRVMEAPKAATVEVKEGGSYRVDAEGHTNLP